MVKGSTTIPQGSTLKRVEAHDPYENKVKI